MNHVLIVTGASSGIGAATARLAAQRGYAVCVNYRQEQSGADEVVQSIQKDNGISIAVQANISNEDDVMCMYETVDRELGCVTGLVNNAGTVAGGISPLSELTGAQIAETLNVNTTGSMLCAREAVRRMAISHGGAGGAIVNVSSVSARLGAGGWYVHYAASKGGIDSFTLGLAREVAEERIRVNAVRPGMIDTEIHAKLGSPNRVKEIEPQLPMKRAGRPEEVAAAIVWLLSNEASYVSGAILDVSGAR